MGKYAIDETLFSEIDNVCMSKRMQKQKNAVENGRYHVLPAGRYRPRLLRDEIYGCGRAVLRQF